jgi:hypothetical protein
VGWGQFQPYVRYLKADRDEVIGTGDTLSPQQFGGDFEQIDIGINYVIAGPNAKISATYSDYKPDDDGVADDQDTNAFIVGVQLQF